MINTRHPFCKKTYCGVSDPLILNIVDLGFNLVTHLINRHAEQALQDIYLMIDQLVDTIEESKLEIAVSRTGAEIPVVELAQSLLHRRGDFYTRGGISKRLDLPAYLNDLLNENGLQIAKNILDYYSSFTKLFATPSIYFYMKELDEYSKSGIGVERQLYSIFKEVITQYYESRKLNFTTYLKDLSSDIGIIKLITLSQESKRMLVGLVPMCIRNFVKIHQVGQGAYGDVWLAEDIVNQRTVALKKLKLNEEREGFPKTAIREILLLNSLRHKNVVKLLGIVHSNTTKVNVWMVFEYMPFDLSGYIEALRDPKEKREKFIRPSRWFSIGEVKNIMLQLFRALAHCHKNNVIHRDLKSANMLISNLGTMKLADFGLARFLPMGKGVLTNRVVTLWYRSPELLLGSETYDTSIDIWSAGCIMGELLCGTPLFASDKEPMMLKIIAERFGLPSQDDLNHLSTLPLWDNKALNPLHPERISSIISRASDFESLFKTRNDISDDGWDLLLSLLKWNSNDRITASDALLHPWFKNSPFIEPLQDRPNVRAAHSFMTKNQRKREMAQPVAKRHETYVKHALAGHLRSVGADKNHVNDDLVNKKQKTENLN